ncbi:uncharacterized protein LOC136746884 isoform X2 [Amia ocellicauda]|uniref:uncharacterized protein LOC136746884 isoform X2 n=1 Tax=Amia ocellicauda TaxID=2972642 RepID=UPI0034646DCE
MVRRWLHSKTHHGKRLNNVDLQWPLSALYRMPNADVTISPSEQEDGDLIEPCLKKLKSSEEIPEQKEQDALCESQSLAQDQTLAFLPPAEEIHLNKGDAVRSAHSQGDEGPEEAGNGIPGQVTTGIGTVEEADRKSPKPENQERNGTHAGTGDAVSVKNGSANTAQPGSETTPVSQRDGPSGSWGTSSTAFIGPKCKSECRRRKKDIENKLSEFYKELEQIGDSGVEGGGQHTTGPSSRAGRNDKRSWDNPRQQSRLEGKSNAPRGNRSSADGGPRPYRDRWQNRRRRPNFHGPGDDHCWEGPEPPYHYSQWEQPQAFNAPHGPPYPRFQGPYDGPPNFPPFYPPDGRPHMNSYYEYPGDDQSYRWEGSQFPPGPGYGDYDFQNDWYNGAQGFGDGAYPPQGYDDQLSSSGFSYYGEAAWSQPYEPGSSDWYQYEQQQEQQQQGQQQGQQQEQQQEQEQEQDQDQEQDQAPESDKQSGSSPVLILMRGVPGSGKSTMAKELLSAGPDGVVFSTDDFFNKDEGYTYDPGLLGDAHDWNQKRAREAMDQGHSPIIIDNTNTQAWEMKPYVKLALERGYRVEFHEPDTSWKSDPSELEKRNKHKVPQEKIAQMLERFEQPMTLDIVLNSQEPSHKASARPPARHRQRNGGIKLKSKQRRNARHRGLQRAKAEDNKGTENHRDVHSSSELWSANSEEEGCIPTSGCVPSGSPVPSQLTAEGYSSDVSYEELRFLHSTHVTKEESVSEHSRFSSYLDRVFENLYTYFGKTIPKNMGQTDPAGGYIVGVEVPQTQDLSVDENGNFQQAWVGDKCCEDVSEFREHMPVKSLPSSIISANFAVEDCSSELNVACFDFESENDNATVIPDSKQPECFCVSDGPPLEDGANKRAFWKPKEFSTKITMSSAKQSNSSDVTEQVTSLNNDFSLLHLKEVCLGGAQDHGISPTGDSTAAPLESNGTWHEKSNGRSSTPRKLRRPYNLAPTFDFAQQRETSCGGDTKKEIAFPEDQNEGTESQRSMPGVSVRKVIEDERKKTCGGAKDTAARNWGSVSVVPMAEDPIEACMGSPTGHKQCCTPAKEHVSRWGCDDLDLSLYEKVQTDGNVPECASSPPKLTANQPDLLSSVTKAPFKDMLEFVEPSAQTLAEEQSGSERDLLEVGEHQRNSIAYGRFPCLRLSLGLALQLEELFGPIGLEFDSLLPEDYVVPLDWKLSELIHFQWKKNIEELWLAMKMRAAVQRSEDWHFSIQREKTKPANTRPQFPPLSNHFSHYVL